MQENKKITLIPGWMNSKGMYEGNYEILEIWKNRIPVEEKIESDYVIAHSLGCNWALQNWEKNRNFKLILVNPLLPKRTLLIWFRKWLRFHWSPLEENPLNKEIVKGIGNWWFGIKACLKLLEYDFDETLESFPRENIVIFYSQHDLFYCDKKLKKYLRSKDIRAIEIEDVGHDWNPKMDEAIEKLLES